MFFKKWKEFHNDGGHSHFVVLLIILGFLRRFILSRGKRRIFAWRATLRGTKNIEMQKDSVLYLGIFGTTKSKILRARSGIICDGKILIKGTVSIQRGSVIEVYSTGKLQLGRGVKINSESWIICVHNISIGNGSSLSWKCQLLDDDLHEIQSRGKRAPNSKENKIVIGKDVLIGNHSLIGKNVIIPDGTILAFGSVVRRNSHERKNCILGPKETDLAVYAINASWEK